MLDDSALVLNATKLADLQSAITAYTAMVGGPRAAIVMRAAITAAIEAELMRADRIIKEQLDNLVVQFAEDHPQFVAAYQDARTVVGTGGRSAAGKPAPVPAPTPA